MSAVTNTPRRRLRGCLFRLTVALVPPLVLLGALEAGLRMAGWGAPSGFLIPLAGGERLATNPRFGERFFPAALAREPVAQELVRDPRPATVRLAVVGGSAAMGTPEPAFGFGRVLVAMLEERHPERRFELVNAAMAAIDSRVVREVVGELAPLAPDLVLVYAGNNELVGPFGPGSFGDGLPPEPLVRARLTLGRLRVSQLVRRLAAPLRRRHGPAGWRGMESFLDRRLAEDDPLLAAVRRRFAANLEAVVAAARRGGARAVLSTVAVNLRDSPPFASLNREGLGDAGRRRWQAQVDRAAAAHAEGDPAAAVTLFDQAAAIDDRHAGLHYRRGRALLAAGRPAEAAAALALARDLDALRFRADSATNAALREVAAKLDTPLVDAERLLAAAPESAGGVPGGELFWEHVHLRLAGSYRLAAAFLPVVERRLDLPVGAAPPLAAVAARLGRTAFDRHAEAAAIYELVRRPPFTGQQGHRRRLLALRREASELVLVARRGRAADAARLEAALARRPDDLHLAERRAAFLEAAGRPAEAAAEWRRLVARLPHHEGWRTRLAFALADAGRPGEAESELRRVAAGGRARPDALVNLALVVTRRGRAGDAEKLLREARERDPWHQGAAVNLARLLEKGGRAGEARELLARLVAEHPSPLAARTALAELLDRQGRLEEAVAAYHAALAEDPFEPRLLNNLGYAAERLGRRGEAARRYRQALAADPGLALAHFNLADLALAGGERELAARHYRAGLALAPGNEQAARNLALAEN